MNKMEPEHYFEIAKKVIIEVVGLGKKEASSSKRPNKAFLKEICNRTSDGACTFEDVAVFRATEQVTVSEIKIYYSGKQVGHRIIPDLLLALDDTLEVTYALTIYRNRCWVRFLNLG